MILRMSTFNYVEVPLTETEIMVCTYIGKLRNHVTSQFAKDRRQDKTIDGVKMSIDGVLTEYAVSKYLKLPFDLNCDFRKFGADLVTRKGKKIDVKCASKIGGKVVEENQERDADQAARREIADIIDHAIEMQKQAIRVELGQLANKSPAPSAESIESKIASYKDACGPKGELAILKSRLNCRPLVVNTTCNVPTNGDLRSFMECVVPADLLRSAGKDNQSPTLFICDP